ncbi:hypothetical protein PRK78_007017 [Emydomyces testavorans]|uniref:Uncharacterized protein n=1 Tax=Emydomyces testavorans TaxID=2070801 RepID=A0AAF0IMC3_9EURO|nr:hypothetical protein PRK78_007017 [Emydomyces testavorans]
MTRDPSPSPSILTSFVRWVRLKNYQYEVTFALYMLTPMEKFIFNSLVLLVISMFLTAAYIYLPNHIVTVCQHAWYYYTGGDPLCESIAHKFGAGGNVSSALAGAEGRAQQNVIMETAKVVAETTAKRLAEL